MITEAAHRKTKIKSFPLYVCIYVANNTVPLLVNGGSGSKKLGHWSKFQKLHIYSLSTPEGVEIELIFALRTVVSEILAYFQNCHIWAWFPEVAHMHIYTDRSHKVTYGLVHMKFICDSRSNESQINFYFDMTSAYDVLNLQSVLVGITISRMKMEVAGQQPGDSTFFSWMSTRPLACSS